MVGEEQLRAIEANGFQKYSSIGSVGSAEQVIVIRG